MKKLLLAAAVAACGIPVSWAQGTVDPRCATATPEYGPPPGCANSGSAAAQREMDDRRMGYGYYGYGYPPAVYSDNRVIRQRPNEWRPTRRDRDGDGVQNRYDRYPEDPRRY